MGNDTLRRNKEIRGPRGALTVLNHLDFERIQASGLQTKVVLYMGRGGVCLDYAARYEGTASATPDLILPAPKYLTAGLPQKCLESCVPASLFFGPPSKLEFVLSAKTKPEYAGLLAFRDGMIPELIKKGYAHPSVDHMSHFWFYAGLNDVKTHMLTINGFDGLQVSQREVDGVQLFTEMDVDRLMDLKLRNPSD